MNSQVEHSSERALLPPGSESWGVGATRKPTLLLLLPSVRIFFEMICVGTEQWHFSQSDVDQVNQLNEHANSNDSFCRNSQFVNIRKPSIILLKTQNVLLQFYEL